MPLRNYFICFLCCYQAGTLKAQSNLPADKNADPKTIALYHNLQKLRISPVYGNGHQDDLVYGVIGNMKMAEAMLKM